MSRYDVGRLGVGRWDGVSWCWLVGVRGEGVKLVVGSPGGVVVGVTGGVAGGWEGLAT